MTLSDQFHAARRNLGRRRMRFFLASLGVMVGTLTIVMLISLALGIRGQINRQFASIGLDRLTIMPSGRFGFGADGPFSSHGKAKGNKTLTPADVARWKTWPGVAKVSPQVNLPGSVNLEVQWKGKTQSVRMNEWQPRPGPGMQATPTAVAGTLDLPDRDGIILSQGTLTALGVASNDFATLPAQPLNLVLRTPRGESQAFPLRVTGVSSEKSSNIQVSPSDCATMKNWWYNTNNLLETSGYDSVEIRSGDVAQARTLIPRLREEGWQVVSLDMFVEVANRIVVAITIMLGLIGSVALLVASIGITNTMVMAVYERTREIGILKSMGASNGDIRRLFMIESGLIGLAGGVMGLLSGWALGGILNLGISLYLQHQDLPMRGSFFVVSPMLALGVTAFAALIGIAAGLLPAHRAATLDPLAALRHD